MVDIKEGIIDLGWGHPSAHLHPTKFIKEGTSQLFDRNDDIPLQYGATQGFGPFLNSLAVFLSSQSSYYSPVSANNLFLTAGASQGIDLACTLFTKSGDTVIEAGTGSAALTLSLAQTVAPNGKVVTFENNPKHSLVAEKNLEMSPWKDLVKINKTELSETTKEIRADSIFLDLPNPEIRTARGGLGSPAWSAGGPDGLVSSLLRARVA